MVLLHKEAEVGNKLWSDHLLCDRGREEGRKKNLNLCPAFVFSTVFLLSFSFATSQIHPFSAFKIS